MPIRGQRSIWPKAGSPPTGIFSSKGSQKVDSTEKFTQKQLIGKNQNGPTSKPKSTSKPMHQPPNNGKVK